MKFLKTLRGKNERYNFNLNKGWKMKPDVSILLPSVRKEAMTECLDCILQNTIGVNFEIIIIGDVFPDDRFIFSKFIYEKERRGVVVALLEAYKQSRGEFVIPMTDDARPFKNWLRPVLDEVKKDKKNIGDFEVMPYNPFQYWGIKFSPFCLISKGRCEEIGGFMDSRFKSFYGDPDLCLRNHVQGGKLVTAQGCKILHKENNDIVHQVIASKYTNHDRQLFIEKWEPVFGAFPGDP